MPQEYRLRCLSAIMTECLTLHLTRSRIDQTNFLVLAGSDQFGTIPIPARTVNNIWMAVDFNKGLARAYVPNDGLIV